MLQQVLTDLDGTLCSQVIIRINSLRCKSRPKPHAMNTLHDVWQEGGAPTKVYSTDASKAPVSMVVPRFICTKIR
jgi:hypothetical protein